MAYVRVPQFGDASGSPTVGVSISPWVIALVAAVYLAPKLLGVTLAHRRESKKE